MFHDLVKTKSFPSDYELTQFWKPWIDVRDLGLAHVLALEIDKAGGQRLVTVAGTMSKQDIRECFFLTVAMMSPLQNSSVSSLLLPSISPRIIFSLSLNPTSQSTHSVCLPHTQTFPQLQPPIPNPELVILSHSIPTKHFPSSVPSSSSDHSMTVFGTLHSRF